MSDNRGLLSLVNEKYAFLAGSKGHDKTWRLDINVETIYSLVFGLDLKYLNI